MTNAAIVSSASFSCSIFIFERCVNYKEIVGGENEGMSGKLLP